MSGQMNRDGPWKGCLAGVGKQRGREPCLMGQEKTFELALGEGQWGCERGGAGRGSWGPSTDVCSSGAGERAKVESHGNGFGGGGGGGGQGFVRHVGESRVFPVGSRSHGKFENRWNWRENPWGGLP